MGRVHFIQRRKEERGKVGQKLKEGRLLRAVNHSCVALVPEVPNPQRMTEFRPSSRSNIIYKSIAEITVNRLQIFLPEFISPNQSAFVRPQSIRDNVLLTHELVKVYHKFRIGFRCVIKADIMKDMTQFIGLLF